MPWTLEQHITSMRQAGVRLPFAEPADSNRPDEELFREYLDREPAAYHDLVAALSRQLPPLSPSCRIAVFVPCRNESLHIGRLLDLLHDQRDLTGRPLDPDQFEVLLLCNYTAEEAGDDTSAVVARWGRQPQRRWRPRLVSYRHAPAERAPVTAARKLAVDIILWRAARRPRAAGPLYLDSEDADLAWIDPRQLARMVAALDRNRSLDAVRGQQDRCPWILARYPLLFLMRRSWNFTEAFLSRRSLWPDRNPAYNFTWNRIVTSGWNTAITARAYAQVGGYTRCRRLEEDMDLGEKISVLRGRWVAGRCLPRVDTVGRISCRSEGSPRRWLYRLRTGLDPYDDRDDYSNFYAPAHERAVKFRALADLEEGVSPCPLNSAALTEAETLLNNDLRFLVQTFSDPDRAGAAYRSILGWLGFGSREFDLADGRLQLRSLAGPAGKIASYAARCHDLEVRGYPSAPALGKRVSWRLSAVCGSRVEGWKGKREAAKCVSDLASH